jgi:hypothetical protein
VLPTRLVVVSFLALLGLLLFTPALADDGVQVEVLSDSGDRIVLAYSFGGHEAEPVDIGGHEYLLISLPGEPVSMDKGAPALPHVNRSLIIPDDAAMAVQVLSASYEEIPVKVAPSKGNLYRDLDPATVPYELGQAYGIDAFQPASLATLGEAYILRDHRGMVVRVNPFRYNPVTGILRVYSEMTVEVYATGPGQTNVLGTDGPERKLVKAFHDLYGAHFLNYGSTLDYDPIDEQGDMLVICHDDWISNMDAFVAHKASLGLTTTVVGVSTIGNDPTSIKQYIQDTYDTSDLAFVLLVGDAAQVATPTASGGSSDPSYTKLAGGDHYPEIIIGRMSAGTAAELDTQTERTITYETLPATSQDWFWKGTGIASAEGAGIGDEGQSDKQHQDEIRGWLLGAGYTEVDQIYDPGATDTQVSNAVNAGRGIINYTGHGSSTSWGTTGFNNADVDALVNDDMLPFIFSVACVNGNFANYGKCFAEAWLRATNDISGDPTGAIAMYASSINQSWAPPMEAQDEFNMLISDPLNPYQSFGALCFAASSQMMDAYGAAGVEMFDTWHIFGDPSVIVEGEPVITSGMKVTPAEGLSGTCGPGDAPGTDRQDYMVQNLDEVPIDYEAFAQEPWVTVLNPTGTLAPNDSATVTVVFNEGAQNLDCGDHHDTVRFENLTSHEGDTTRPVDLSVGSLMTLHDWNLDSDPGWTAEGEWEFGVPQGNGGAKDMNPDPTAGATGTTVYGANLAGQFSKAPGGPYWLTLGPLDLTDVHGVSLAFQRWLNSAAPPEIDSMVEVSPDGFSWATVWSSSALMADAAWTPQSFDISGPVDGGSAVYVRWGYQVVSRVPQAGAGWNIDDVTLTGSPGTVRIELSMSGTSLSWSSVGGVQAYDVVRGDAATLQSTGGDFSVGTKTCLGDDLPATTVDDPNQPPAGQVWWYLVRGICSEGPMTYQNLAGGNQVGVRDAEIEASGVSCP